jgi:hypothetical protein
MLRTGTVNRGLSYGKGSSSTDIQLDEYNQLDDVLLPNYLKGNEKDALAFMQRRSDAYNHWKASPPPSNGMKPKFSEFFEEKEKTFQNQNGKKSNRLFGWLSGTGGISRRRRRPSRKYKKSKRVFRKKSRSTRRR